MKNNILIFIISINFLIFLNVNADPFPPVFSPYGVFISSNPAPLITNLYIYIIADEDVISTNSDGSTNNFPLIKVIQGTETNNALHYSGTNTGPFTNIYSVTNIDGIAEIWAIGSDLSVPTNNWTNQLVGTFWVDTTYPVFNITNYTTYSYTTTNLPDIYGYGTETNINITLNVFSESNSGSLIYSISNKNFLSSNFIFTNIILSNKLNFTNWLNLEVTDKAGNKTNTQSIGIILIGIPKIEISKSNVYFAPTLGGYPGGSQDVVPATIIEYFLNYTNTGTTTAYAVRFIEEINSNTLGYLSNSIVNADDYKLVSGSNTNTTAKQIVDYNINKLEIIINEVSVNTGGQVRYKLVVK